MRARMGTAPTIRLLSSGLLITLISAQVAPAWAQTDQERAGARAAATEGAQAFHDHKWAQAVDLFSRAESLVHAPTHLLYLARAQANLGHLVKAEEAYRKIIHDKLDASSPSVFREAQSDANKELRELEPRIPMAKIVVQGGEGKQIDVKMDGNSIPAALVGVPIPMDPGQHMFVATADRMASDPANVSIKEGTKDTTVTLVLKPHADAVAGGTGPGAPGTPAAGAAPAGMPPAPPGSAPMGAPPGQPAGPGAPGAGPGGASMDMSLSSSSGSGNGMRVGSFVALGVGAVGLGLGTVFALKAKSKQNDSDNEFNQFNCGVTGCGDKRSEIDSLANDASSARTAATIGFIAGGVGVAAGVTLLILSGKKHQSAAQSNAPPKATIQPFFGLGSAGVLGTF